MLKFVLLFCILHFALLIAACSIPNFEDKSCAASRTAIREFYSFHFGNDMGFSPEHLKMRERFLSPDLVERLSDDAAGTDPFTTGTSEYPRAFRVGECREIAPDKAEFQVLLFWRDDIRNEQREIKAVAVKKNDKWLLDDVLK